MTDVSRSDDVHPLHGELTTRWLHRRDFVRLAGGLVAASGLASSAMAQNPPASNLAPPPSWQRPVHRVANAALSSTTQPTSVRPTGGHPNLRRGLDMARDALAKSEAQVRDYTATLVKRERIGQTLGEHEFMMVKIRNRKIAGGQVVQPFSVYIQFLKPAATKGREVIYVENQNNGKLIAHEGGMKGRFLPTVSLPVDGMLAMRGQRYPMTEIGVENMIVKLIDRGETALQFDDVSADFFKNARVRDRVCTLLRVKQPTRRPELDFYQADVFLDDQLGLPIRYIAYDWPAPGSPADALGGVIEEYNYLNLQLNVGLSDSDFDSNNPAYNF